MCLSPKEVIEQRKAAERQAASKLRQGISILRTMLKDPKSDCWWVDRIRRAKEEFTDAYDLLVGLTDPLDLLDELADL